MAGQLVPMVACIVWALGLVGLKFSLWLPYWSFLTVLGGDLTEAFIYLLVKWG